MKISSSTFIMLLVNRTTMALRGGESYQDKDSHELYGILDMLLDILTPTSEKIDNDILIYDDDDDDNNIPDYDDDDDAVDSKEHVEQLTTSPYNIYYGYLHSHTGLSDGSGTPYDAYSRAKKAGLDFFGASGKPRLLMFYCVNLSVQYEVSMTWPLLTCTNTSYNPLSFNFIYYKTHIF